MALTTAAPGGKSGALEQSVGRKKFSIIPYLFILPHLIVFLVFIGWPFVFGLAISLFQYDYHLPERSQFVGLDNYFGIFNSTTPEYNMFWNAFFNTLEFVVMSVPLLVVIPLLLAVLLNTKLPGRNIFRGIYFAPWVLSVSVVGLLWWWIFQSTGGLINYYLRDLGLEQPHWLTTLPWAWLTILICTVWWTLGFNMIILLAALQDIPAYLYEAAALDGATGPQQFFRITVPQLQSVIVFIIVTSIIASFNLFGQPFLMTGGGPAQANGQGATTPVMVAIYNEGFIRNFQGNASAMAVLVAIVMIMVSYVNFRFFRRRD